MPSPNSPSSSDTFNNWAKGFLVVMTTLGFFGVIAELLYVQNIAAAVKDILLVMLGALLASYKDITGFFFGSSSSAVKANEVIAASSVQAASSLQALQPSPIPPIPDLSGTPLVKIDDSTPVKVEDTK